ncbi:LamG-like jellyroll fold domain-containing protein [Paraglaciecola aquimarina]|uniref:LamG-like jellyroll fold domain-containing protein n=1 Tax=Paraglaciecola aquimarina TaxID=1235557 RepID=A0ABU3SSZ3_9ALTE|nr:LamG-like jellyroll fold domain-containing protein [Paraglaciecola aquimarina]MDU0353115.1 LamG-like jellyroll fold domain-containing protein [Paraglaciecola aquimarina]
MSSHLFHSLFKKITTYVGILVILFWTGSVSSQTSCSVQSVADDFTTNSYSQNSGSVNWSGNWTEIGESDGVNSGVARVNNSLCSDGSCLRLGITSGSGAGTYNNVGVYRQVDLHGASSATLSFVYRSGVNIGDQTVVLSISNDGGASWTSLRSYYIGSTDTSANSQSFDISSYVADNTQIRFLASANNAEIGMYIDDISISYQPTCSATPIAEYRFEETNWDGTANEVLDYSGNNYHGRVTNGSTPKSSFPALTGPLGTCGYASQTSGSIEIQGLPLDTTTDGVKTTITFWMNWDGTSSIMPIGWSYHDLFLVRGGIGFNTGNADLYGVSSAGLANGWHHIAVEFTNGSVSQNRIHIDGVEQVLSQRTGSPNNDNTYVNSTLRIGGWINSRSYDFYGLIDEVRIYDRELSTAQIETIMSERHPCPAKPIAEYRFDELLYNDLDNTVQEHVGGLNGQAGFRRCCYWQSV